MRVYSKEYQEMLDHSEVWQTIMNTPRPDYTQMEKEAKEFEEWIKKEHEKDRQLIIQAAKHRIDDNASASGRF